MHVSKPETKRLMTVHQKSQGGRISEGLRYQDSSRFRLLQLINSPLYLLFVQLWFKTFFNSKHITKIIPPKIKGSKLTCTNQLFSYLSRLLPWIFITGLRTIWWLLHISCSYQKLLPMKNKTCGISTPYQTCLFPIVFYSIPLRIIFFIARKTNLWNSDHINRY